MLRILIVCTGNICRSPLAAALLSSRVDERRVSIESAGTRALVGRPMTDETATIARELGVAERLVDSHRARQLDEDALRGADLVLALSREHRRSVVELSPSHVRSSFTLREFARLSADASDDELAEIAAGPRAARRARRIVTWLGERRTPDRLPRKASDDDVPDPYGGDRGTYDRSTAAIVPAVDAAARLFRAGTRWT